VKEEPVTTHRPDPALPRNTFSLNGSWDVQPGGAGIPPAAWNRRVPVPGLVDLAEPHYDWRDAEYHWYRTQFAIDLPTPAGSALLTLEQAMFGTDVWLNGRRVGGDIACYTSQEYDVRGTLTAGAPNELLVRVGARGTLPPESAVGNDQERIDFIPGIWGDVRLTICGNPRIARVQVIPHLGQQAAEVRVTVANAADRECAVRLRCAARERTTGRATSLPGEANGMIPALAESIFTTTLSMRDVRPWSPDDPFLYEVDSLLAAGGLPADRVLTTFGMREFRISGPEFLLNGRPIRLRGGNIAFHRFLSDAGRRALPWDLGWAERLLIDIPKAHNLNFFRIHIGQMYNRWYDLADEHGMLLQNEWPFWTTSGTKEQIGREFTRWLQDNWNHPSIVIWDPLNECSDAVVQGEIVPAMKRLDPTRPWESVDFVEQHPYIYSLGPVLVNRRFGFTESLDAIGASATPSVVNEFLWWWLDGDFHPTLLTRDVVERWLGPAWSKDELIAHQSFLAQELVELFRRMDVKAIQPFVYLSNNAGPTGNWFVGDIAALRPKPVLAALKNAFAPFGISLELWDRHFFTGEQRPVRIFVFNDGPSERNGSVRVGIRGEDGTWLCQHEETVAVGAVGRTVRSAGLTFPAAPGSFWVTAELIAEDGVVSAMSRKIAHVMPPPEPAAELQRRRIALCDTGGELGAYLRTCGVQTEDFLAAGSGDCDALVIAGGLLRGPSLRSTAGAIDRFTGSGKSVVIIEPEYGSTAKEIVPVTAGITLTIEPRTDTDKGGYDSYVFAASGAHPLWEGIPGEHLKMFNGGYGGEIVSEHLVSASVPSLPLARCGLRLGIPAVFELQAGRGRIIVARLQLRGRLMPHSGSAAMYDRRPDPVLQRFFLNLLAYASHRA
jgi:hypothetical protein